MTAADESPLSDSSFNVAAGYVSPEYYTCDERDDECIGLNATRRLRRVACVQQLFVADFEDRQREDPYWEIPLQHATFL